MLKIVKTIELIIFKEKPNIIFTHFPDDLNIDHKIVTEAVLTAARPLKKNKYLNKIFFYETLSSTEWSINEKFLPNTYIDIKDTIKSKLKAIKCYKSELRAFPHPRSVKGIEILAQKRGSEVSLKFAEAFMLFRDVS